jgi:predicted aspartyl protease
LVLTGTVTDNGVPVVMLQVSEQTWAGIIDTGFNGDLELPDGLRFSVNARFIGRASSSLASGQTIEEDVYLVDFPFDGRTVQAEATFAPGSEILVGTQLLQSYRLEIHFPDQTVLLERVS